MSVWTEMTDLPEVAPPGATVALGGLGLSRKPMALIRGLVEAGVRDLTCISFLGSVDVELLLAAGSVAELHTAGVSLEGFGLAPRYRAVRQQGSIPVVEWSEGSLMAALEAAARGLDSLPCSTSPSSDVVRTNPGLLVDRDPFTGADRVSARAFRPDVALLHVPYADEAGNLFVDGDVGVDAILARAAERVVVTASRRAARPLREASLSRVWVDLLAEVPMGARPTGCYPLERADLGTIQSWAQSKGEDLALLGAAG